MLSRGLALSLGALALLGAGQAHAGQPSTTRLLVGFKPGVTATAAGRVLAAANAHSAGSVRGLDVSVALTSSPTAALTSLRRNASVAYAEPDSVLKPQDVLPSDPSFPQQFAIAGGAWGWTKTHTTQAWDVTKGSSSVDVAVLDTGLQTEGLSDFNGQTVSGWNVLTGTSDTSSNAGTHGTYVAGVVGLALDNGAGNVGYCPGCRIMPVQVGTDSGAYVSDMATGITWAADHGARVINLSWAGAAPSTTLDSAVSYARSKGVVVVAAAGNSNCDCTNYPAASPGVLGVAGTDSSDAKSGDSNYGSWVSLAAPESNITAWPTLNGAPGYAPVGGTSLAAPVVAGIAGLLFSADPAATGAQVEQALESTAAPVGFSVKYGRVDALAALGALGYADPQVSQAPVNTTAPQILVETNGDYNNIPLSAAPQVGQVLLRGQGGWVGSAPLALASVRWLRCDSAGANCVVAATAAKYTVQATDSGDTFRLTVTVKNALGSTSMTTAATQAVGTSSTVTVPANTSLPTISGTAQVGQTLAASTGLWSGSPTSYAYQWQRCGSSCSPISGATSSSYALQSGDVGYAVRIGVTATNSAGSSTAYSPQTASVTSAPGSAPANTSPPTISGTAQAGQTLTASTGSWSGSPTSYAYQWQRCGSSCSPISGATTSTYTAQSSDVGYTVVVGVNATNGWGSGTATSFPTPAVVAAPAPPTATTQTLTFSGSLTAKLASQTFSATAGAGASTARLTFNKQCSSLSLAINSGGSTVAATTGPSGLTLAPTLVAGTFSYSVSGGRCSFTLTVTTQSP
jgi:subtilisin family serine protease